MITMECTGENSATLSPLCRVRCNTWHAGLAETGSSQCSHVTPDSSNAVSSSQGVRKPSSRRNAWGPSSYADLIATAIDGAPDRRLTLSQIYDWMVTNVPYFGDKNDSTSSAGWKNSIRHNLSLHKRFVRVPHVDGKSSWWTLSQSDSSSTRWSRTSVNRRRADTMDARSSAMQQKQRRGRKSGTDSVLTDRRSSNKTSQLTVNCSDRTSSIPITTRSNSAVSNDPLAFSPIAAASPSLFSHVIFSSSFDSSSTAVTHELRIDIDNSVSGVTGDNDLSPFSRQRLSPVDRLSSLNHVDELSAECVLSQPSWDSCVTADCSSVDALSLDDSNYATADGDKLSDLFSDIAMTYDDTTAASPHFILNPDGSSLHDSFSRSPSFEPFVTGDESILTHDGSSSASQQSLDLCLRRGSNAPPPSPEFDCRGGLLGCTSDDDQMVVCGAVGSNREHILSAFINSKFSELSNSSDMDTDH